MENINILELSDSIKKEGYEGEYIDAKLCQDIILLLISKSVYANNITIKGGVVMRSISNNTRRATLDIDLDFIRYPLTDEGITNFIESLSGIMGIKIKVIGRSEELKHQDYEGKRVFINIEDRYNNKLTSKIDIGVHKYVKLDQEEYYFDFSFDKNGATLFINSKEQILTEKLKSILKFGILSTRYKDIYDIYFLTSIVNKKKVLDVFKMLIFDDEKMKEKNVADIINRLERTFSNRVYVDRLSSSDKNWLDIPTEEVLDGIINFVKNLYIFNNIHIHSN